ncbi:MAG TPA: glycosyltransferase family A protein [Thermoanaerobaculia bacterium]|nr:glycosyltransferase family A protein [Thermoanaerobaculia bacterium]
MTVIIPTYNWSTVLPYSIASALEQTFADFELLVIGDRCTDDSERVVTSFTDPRVHWINLAERSGHQSGPNNEGIRRARGEYIAYLGHDDLWLPHHLAVLVTALDAGADVAHSMLAIVDPDGTVMPGSLPPTSVAHRHAMIDVIGGWRDYRELTIPPEDDLWRRARAAGMKFTFVHRLTAIKFGASSRRNVYRERPCHEQAAWLARIRAEPDLETTELVKLVYALARPGTKPTMVQRVMRFVRRPWLLPGAVWRHITPKKGQDIRRIKRFKGVEG